MLKDRKPKLAKELLLVASTNLLASGVLLLLGGIHSAASWYWNINLGSLPLILAMAFLLLVNLWLFFGSPLNK